MNGHCGITGSTYRPVEAGYPLLLVDTPVRDPRDAARAIFACILGGIFIGLGVIVGAAMGVKL